MEPSFGPAAMLQGHFYCILIHVMSTGRQRPILPGVPTVVGSGDVAPIRSPFHIDRPPEAGDPPHLDIEATLREMYMTMQALQADVARGGSSSESLRDDEFITSVAKSVSRKNIVGKTLMWIAGGVGTIFSMGMAYAVFMGANATDDEVEKSVKDAIIEHNSGNDPHALNAKGELIGSHPKMRQSIEDLKSDTAQVKNDVSDIKEAQKKSDKRGEYQYEFSRWQGEIIECERKKNCKAPKRPDTLKRLESEIHLGKF